MRIAVITDLHANLPALEAASAAIRHEGCDLIFHTGDAIAIGPYPAECLDALLNTPHVQFLIGNHETYFVHGLPQPQPAYMSDGEVEHQRWTHAQLDPQLRSVLAKWPYVLECSYEGVKVVFMHYALEPSGQDFAPVIKHASTAALDEVFAPYDAALVFYGHHHPCSDLRGRARYVNPGSLGCHDQAIARYCIAEFTQGRYIIQHRAIPYDDTPLRREFELRNVPDRRFIYRAFFGGRFHE